VNEPVRILVAEDEFAIQNLVEGRPFGRADSSMRSSGPARRRFPASPTDAPDTGRSHRHRHRRWPQRLGARPTDQGDQSRFSARLQDRRRCRGLESAGRPEQHPDREAVGPAQLVTAVSQLLNVGTGPV